MSQVPLDEVSAFFQSFGNSKYWMTKAWEILEANGKTQYETEIEHYKVKMLSVSITGLQTEFNFLLEDYHTGGHCIDPVCLYDGAETMIPELVIGQMVQEYRDEQMKSGRYSYPEEYYTDVYEALYHIDRDHFRRSVYRTIENQIQLSTGIPLEIWLLAAYNADCERLCFQSYEECYEYTKVLYKSEDLYDSLTESEEEALYWLSTL